MKTRVTAFTFSALALGLACVALVTAAPTDSPLPKVDIEVTYEQGMEAVRAKDYAKALGLFTEADRVKPNDPDVLNMLGYTNRKTGKLDEARLLYVKALKLRSEFPECREYLGECYLELAKREYDTVKSYGDKGAPAADQLAQAFAAMNTAVATGQQPAMPERAW